MITTKTIKISGEIEDIKSFIEIELYNQKNNIKNNCLDINYINHHNFHYE